MFIRDKDGLDYERKKTYQVTIAATDPSGEKDSVTVNVIITDLNEEPDWVMGKAPGRPDHEENDTGVVATYEAKDPEGSGLTYTLSTVEVPDPNGDGEGTLATMMMLLRVPILLIAPCSRSTLLTASSASSRRPITKIRRTASLVRIVPTLPTTCTR